MTYNLTNLSNATSIDELFINMNQLSGNFLSSGIIIVFYVILFVMMLRFGTKQAFATTSFITSILVSLMYALGVVPFAILFTLWILSALGMLWLYVDKDSG